jgi:uncharacterized protein (TIGR00730 family)
MEKKLVIVFGSSRTKDAEHLDNAYRLGKMLAEAGYIVGSGGYKAVMEAVSRGAAEAGGYVIGYTTDEFPEAIPNPWLSEERRTDDLHLRMRRMMEEGDAFIATWGGIGTLTEVVLAWNVAQVAPYRGRPIKPLYLVGEHWKPIVETLGRYSEMGSGVRAYPTLVPTVEAAVAMLKGHFAVTP